MADGIGVYNPKKVVCLIGGLPVGGFADGTFISIEQQTDGITSQSGADGEIALAVGTDDRHTVTITLQQTSDDNERLSALYTVARLTDDASLLFPIIIEDLFGKTSFAVTQAWLPRRANVGLAKEIGTREWVFHTGKPTVFVVGGNM